MDRCIIYAFILFVHKMKNFRVNEYCKKRLKYISLSFLYAQHLKSVNFGKHYRKTLNCEMKAIFPYVFYL